MNISETTSSETREALLAISVFAAFADGNKSEAERESVRRMAADLGGELSVTLPMQVLSGRLTLADAVGGLKSASDRLMAYEMALAVCETDEALSQPETDFLADLKTRLGLATAEAAPVERSVETITLAAPVTTPAAGSPLPDNAGMVLRYAILNGALELLPETLATVAIIPLQMKMVYRIGASHGHSLDRSHIKELAAAAGLGLGSQVVEGFARKFFKGLGRSVGGKMGGRAAEQLAGSGMSFASTYAIGHLADRYYAGGRKLGNAEMKTSFESLKNSAMDLHAKYLPEIRDKAATLTPDKVLSLVRGSQSV